MSRQWSPATQSCDFTTETAVTQFTVWRIRELQWTTLLMHGEKDIKGHACTQLLTWGVSVLVMLCTALVVVIVLLSVMRVSAVRVFTVCVVIRVCVSHVLVYVTGIGMTSAPFPSVGNWNSNVDWLHIWETERQRTCKCWIRNSPNYGEMKRNTFSSI